MLARGRTIRGVASFFTFRSLSASCPTSDQIRFHTASQISGSAPSSVLLIWSLPVNPRTDFRRFLTSPMLRCATSPLTPLRGPGGLFWIVGLSAARNVRASACPASRPVVASSPTVGAPGLLRASAVPRGHPSPASLFPAASCFQFPIGSLRPGRVLLQRTQLPLVPPAPG